MKTYKINEEIEINELDNELIIVVPQTEKMFFCNKIIKEIVYGFRDGLNVEQLALLLLSKYDIDRRTIESDIQEALENLVHYKILIREE